MQVTPDGLALDDGRTLAWADVYHVEWTSDGGLVATAVGVVTVDRASAAAIEARIAPWEAARDAWVAALPPAEREAWAELGPGESLLARPSRLVWLGLLAFWASSALVLYIQWRWDFWAPSRVVPVWLAQSYALLWFRRRPTVRLDADGLTVDRSPRIAWSALREAGTQPSRLLGPDLSKLHLLTRHGRLVLGLYLEKDGSRLRPALERALAARAAAVPATGGLFAPSLRQPGAGLWLDEQALVVVSPDRAERVPLSALTPPVWLGAGPRVAYGGRSLAFADYLGGATLAEALDRQLTADEPLLGPDGKLKAAVIERWLGLGPGETLRCHQRGWLGWTCALVAATAGLLWTDTPFGLCLAFFGTIFWAFNAPVVAVDARGLSVPRGYGRGHYAWAEVQAVRDIPTHVSIVVRGRELMLARTLTGCERVAGIARRLVAVRDGGLPLPDVVPVPDTALSRLGGTTEASERGLSLSEEDRP